MKTHAWETVLYAAHYIHTLCKKYVYMYNSVSVPGPPKRIKAVLSSPTTIAVSWLPPNHENGIVVEYYVYIRYVVVLCTATGVTPP